MPGEQAASATANAGQQGSTVTWESPDLTADVQAWVANPAVSGKTAYLIVDATSGREISSDQADELRHPASLTKLMTAYVIFQKIKAGKLTLDQKLPVSELAH